MNYKKLTPGAKAPTRSDKLSVGYDLYTSEDFLVTGNGTRAIVPTGIAIELPAGFEGEVKPRSGFSAKGVLACRQTPVYDSEGNLVTTTYRFNADVKIGTIDPGYTGMVGIILQNNDSYNMFIPRHTRLAQLVIRPVVQCDWEEVEELSDSERATQGFGHSGAR